MDGDGGADPDDAGAGADGGVACLPVSGDGTPMVTGLPPVRRLAADDTHLYGSVSSSYVDAVGRVVRISLAGGFLEDVATGLTAPDSIAVSPTGVPFVLDKGGVWRIDPGTMMRTRINTTLNNAGFGESDMAIDGDALIVATGLRALMRVQQDGSGATTMFLAPGGAAVRGVALSGPDLFFLVAEGTAPGIYRMPKDGSAQATRLRPEPKSGHSLIVDGANLVWSEGDQGTGKVAQAPIAGGPTLVLAENLQHPFRLARLKDALYFKDTTIGAASPSFLRAIGNCGVQDVGPSGVGPGDLLVKDGVLFFTSEDFTTQSFISRLP